MNFPGTTGNGSNRNKLLKKNIWYFFHRQLKKQYPDQASTRFYFL